MSLNDKDKKSIKKIIFENNEFLESNDKKIYLESFYHGDRDEHWVIIEEDGEEIERHNCRYIKTIEWENNRR